MKVQADQLEGQLARGIPAVTLIEGDETLLVIESGDLIRQHALELGYERQVMDAGPSFNWGELIQARSDLSLFATETLLELRLPKGRLDAKAVKALDYYLQDPPPEKRLVIQCPGLERGEANKAWVKQVNQLGWWISAPKFDLSKFPNWVRGELNRRRIRLDEDAFQLLIERVEGNALAAKQEVEKLALFAGDEPMSADEVAQISAESAKYTVFNLTDACLYGRIEKVIHICKTLEAEGAEPIAIMGMMNNTLEKLSKILDHSGGQAAAFSHAKVFGRSESAFKSALSRINRNTLIALHQQASRTDRAIKGQSKTPAWLSLTQLALRLAGARTPAS
ncbi:MAG: DNA polymerase III subunit delta [Litorivicinus sp.]